MSEYRRHLICKSKNAEDYDGISEVKNMSNWVDNESWSYGDTTTNVISWTGRCCYPKYIKLDPKKNYRIYFPTTNTSGYVRFLNASKVITKTVQGTTVVDSGTSYLTVFSTVSLANTKSAWGTNYVNIVQV